MPTKTKPSPSDPSLSKPRPAKPRLSAPRPSNLRAATAAETPTTTKSARKTKAPRRTASPSMVLAEPPPAPAGADPKTLGEGIYLRLRADLIAGRIAPGTRLPFRQLSARYAVGIGPLREALVRLSSEQLVAFEGQRGFVAAPLSIRELKDLCGLRVDLTCRALREAMALGGEDWEDEILVALHRLERSPMPASFDDDAAMDEWERRHDRFHTSLIAACDSKWLLHFCATLSDQFQRYRRVSVVCMAQSHTLFDTVRSQHRAMAEAVLARQADEAVAILRSHFEGSVARVIDQIETFVGKISAA
ncbi:FCD domain-containing protein [Azorhizobium sp. AG788]|uniref:GntR family transcriptional regulator n=1 Tax=Azorhizobium sp. AG788 TaxID=2183897 RepID=UPI0031393E41